MNNAFYTGFQIVTFISIMIFMSIIPTIDDMSILIRSVHFFGFTIFILLLEIIKKINKE